jgi:hypothetical protein
MKGLLVRVGVDQAYGYWNGPINPDSKDFCYVPIPQEKSDFRLGYERSYQETHSGLERFGLELPKQLVGQYMHLDPDFKELTYGDQGKRAKRIQNELGLGDFIVFYASLKPISDCEHKLLYSIIGIYFIESFMPAKDIEKKHWHKNAHTRIEPDESDIVISAIPSVSGRFKHCIPIGEFRQKAYRVKNDILAEWGGLSVKNGYIHRSAYLPSFQNPEKFLLWLKTQNVTLLHQNY